MMYPMDSGRVQPTNGTPLLIVDYLSLFCNWLYTELGYKSMEDWYNITREDIYKNGGKGMLKTYYNGSPSSVLQSVFPDHTWDLTMFKHKPQRFWKTDENHKKFFDQLMIKLGYNSMEDWYNVSREDIHKNGGG